MALEGPSNELVHESGTACFPIGPLAEHDARKIRTRKRKKPVLETETRVCELLAQTVTRKRRIHMLDAGPGLSGGILLVPEQFCESKGVAGSHDQRPPAPALKSWEPSKPVGLSNCGGGGDAEHRIETVAILERLDRSGDDPDVRESLTSSGRATRQ